MFLMTTLSGNNLRGSAFWFMGDLSTPQPRSLQYLLAFGFVIAAGAIYTTASDLNLLLAGEKEAMHLGVDVPRVRIVVYIAASILTGLAVSVSGTIAMSVFSSPTSCASSSGLTIACSSPLLRSSGANCLVIADTLARIGQFPYSIASRRHDALAGAPLSFTCFAGELQ